MTAQDLINDLNLLVDRLEENFHPDEQLKISGMYVWCYGAAEFEAASKLMGTTCEPTYQATNMSLRDVLPGGLELYASVDYSKIGKKLTPNPPEPTNAPPSTFEIDPKFVKIIEEKIGKEMPKV